RRRRKRPTSAIPWPSPAVDAVASAMGLMRRSPSTRLPLARVIVFVAFGHSPAVAAARSPFRATLTSLPGTRTAEQASPAVPAAAGTGKADWSGAAPLIPGTDPGL